jgi:hypothetical protein
MPEALWDTDILLWEGRRSYGVVTPLCAAALAGRTEMVRLLLERGAPAAEERWGYPSHWRPFRQEGKSRSIPLTPLAAALLGGHRETAALLRRYGASCDIRGPDFRELWNQFHEEMAAPGGGPSGKGVLRQCEEDIR